jgi:hypothetical protein
VYLNVDAVVVTDKKHMAELFNHHIIKSGFLFDSVMPPCPSNISHRPLFFPCPATNFSLQAVTESEVPKKLLKVDPNKPSGSDGLDHFFFKVALPIIAKPISDLFNLSLLWGDSHCLEDSHSASFI